MKILKKWKERREQKRRLRELATLAQQHRTLIKLQEAGLLTWNPKTRQLFIAEPLARIYMTDADRWLAFMHNVYLYEQYRLTSAAWEEYMQREELAAVRAAIREHELSGEPPLSHADIGRIRRARRAEIAQSDMQPPRVEPVEFYIVRDTTDSEPQVVAIGHYEPETQQMELATWDEVRRLMDEVRTASEKEKKKKK